MAEERIAGTASCGRVRQKSAVVTAKPSIYVLLLGLGSPMAPMSDGSLYMPFFFFVSIASVGAWRMGQRGWFGSRG